MVWVLDLSWGRNLSFVSISRLGRHAQPPCTTCKSLRLNLYNCDSQVDCAFHLHLVLRLAQFVLIILGHIVLRLVLVCLYLCACVLVCLCAQPRKVHAARVMKSPKEAELRANA